MGWIMTECILECIIWICRHPWNLLWLNSKLWIKQADIDIFQIKLKSSNNWHGQFSLKKILEEMLKIEFWQCWNCIVYANSCNPKFLIVFFFFNFLPRIALHCMIGVKNNKPTCLSVLCRCMPVEHDALQIETSLYRLRSLVRTVQASTTVGGSNSLLALPFWVETNGALFSGQNIYFYGAYTWALIGTKRSLRQRFFSADATLCVHVVTEMVTVTVMDRGYTAHCDAFTWFAASVSKLFYCAQEKGKNYFVNRKNDNSLFSSSCIATL